MQGLHLHSLGLVLIVPLRAWWFSSRRDMRDLQQHKSAMSTPDNYHDRKSQIPQVTLFILPHPDRSEVSLGIRTYHPVSMKMKKEWEGFFPKQKGNINWRQTLSFICACFLQCCTYGFSDFGTYTFPLFYNQQRLMTAVTGWPRPMHTRLVIAPHVVSRVHRHC